MKRTATKSKVERSIPVLDRQQSGMYGVFLVCAELAKRGWIVSPTSRNAYGADILASDRECTQAIAIQVKCQKGNPRFWLMSRGAQKLNAKSFVYVLVNLNGGNPRYFVVPSKVVAQQVQSTESKMPKAGVWWAFRRDEAYLDAWHNLSRKA